MRKLSLFLIFITFGTAAVPSVTMADEIDISPEEHAARLKEQKRLAQDIREKMEKGVTDDTALRDALHMMLTSPYFIGVDAWIMLTKELLQEFKIPQERAAKILEGIAREKLAAMERGEWDNQYYTVIRMFDAFPDYDSFNIFKGFLQCKYDSVQMQAILTYTDIKGANASPLIREAMQMKLLDGNRRNLLYGHTPSVIHKLTKENKADEAAALSAFINEMKQGEPELKLADEELKQRLFGYTGYSDFPDNTIHTLINRNGIPTEQLTRVIEGVVREGIDSAAKGRSVFWEWENENDRMAYNAAISRLEKAMYLLPLFQNANTVPLLRECVLCKDEGVSLQAALFIVDFLGVEAFPFLLECFEKGRLTHQTRWLFYANLDGTFGRFKEKHGDDNAEGFYALVKGLAQLEQNDDDLHAQRIDKFLCSNFGDYETSGHRKEIRDRFARLGQISEILGKASSWEGLYASKDFCEKMKRYALEKEITPEEVTEEMERRIQYFVSYLEGQHGAGYLRRSSYVIGNLHRGNLKALEVFNGPNTLVRLKEMTLAGHKYEFLRSEAMITYINIAGAESIPFLHEALEKEGCVPDATRSEIVIHLEKVVAKFTEENKTNDVEKINAFLKEMKQAEQAKENGGN